VSAELDPVRAHALACAVDMLSGALHLSFTGDATTSLADKFAAWLAPEPESAVVTTARTGAGSIPETIAIQLAAASGQLVRRAAEYNALKTRRAAEVNASKVRLPDAAPDEPAPTTIRVEIPKWLAEKVANSPSDYRPEIELGHPVCILAADQSELVGLVGPLRLGSGTEFNLPHEPVVTYLDLPGKPMLDGTETNAWMPWSAAPVLDLVRSMIDAPDQIDIGHEIGRYQWTGTVVTVTECTQCETGSGAETHSEFLVRRSKDGAPRSRTDPRSRRPPAAPRTATPAAAAAGQIEDVEWLRRAGCGWREACERLDLPEDALSNFLRRQGRPDLREALKQVDR
jgi:hypothetical protein